jgi:GTP-binding protein EngB required for normal cell division
MLYNIFLCQYRENEEFESNDLTTINNYLLQFASSYNEIGDYLSNKISDNNNLNYNFINILCVGRTCTGKSTFINTFFKERKCLVVGNGLSKTKRINFYSDFSKQIRIYDTIGFEGEESTSKIIKLLQRLNVELINCKQKIHLILYFIQGKINFEEHEYKVFNEIIKYKSHIIFIKTHSKNNLPETYQREKNRLYENIGHLYKKNEQNLIQNNVSNKEIEKIKELYVNYLLNYDKFENLILMNLRKDEDDSKIFGMDNLYKAIYNYLKDHIIRIQDINNIEFDNNQNNPNNNNNINPIYFIIKDNLFLKKYRTIKDIFESLQWDKKLIIAKNAFYAGLSGINPIPLIDIGTYYLIEKNLKTELARLYQFDIDKNVFLNEKYNKNEIEKNKEINNKIENPELGLVVTYNSTKILSSGISFINDLKNITNIKIIIDEFVNVCRSSLILYFVGNVIGGAFNVGLIIYEGNLFANFFENELRKDQGVNYLINAAKSYNKAIKSFKDLAQIEDDVEIIID